MIMDVYPASERREYIVRLLEETGCGYKAIYEELMHLEETMGDNSKINALGHYKEDGFAQLVTLAEENNKQLSNLFDELCKQI